jgi:hypothetical protein
MLELCLDALLTAQPLQTTFLVLQEVLQLHQCAIVNQDTHSVELHVSYNVEMDWWLEPRSVMLGPLQDALLDALESKQISPVQLEALQLLQSVHAILVTL